MKFRVTPTSFSSMIDASKSYTYHTYQHKTNPETHERLLSCGEIVTYANCDKILESNSRSVTKEFVCMPLVSVAKYFLELLCRFISRSVCACDVIKLTFWVIYIASDYDVEFMDLKEVYMLNTLEEKV